MSSDSLSAIPEPLRGLLRQELDPAEMLRWCGKPNADRVFKSATPLAPAASLVIAAFAGPMTWLCVVISLGVSEIRPSSSGQPESTWTTLVVAALLTGALRVFALAAGRQQWADRDLARRAVYAVTNTRIPILRTNPAGLIRTDVIEPGHPLRIQRHDHDDGTGDIILLYPVQQSRQSQFCLAAKPEPRAVERLIRNTFDPPSSFEGTGARSKTA
jgi:hypothetical protein